jgi:membrane-bound ClpP family serine protease
LDSSLLFILVTLAVLLFVAVLVFVFNRGGQHNRLTPLAAIAFCLIIAGILFNANQIVAFGLMGVGIVLAVLDVCLRRKKN